MNKTPGEAFPVRFHGLAVHTFRLQQHFYSVRCSSLFAHLAAEYAESTLDRPWKGPRERALVAAVDRGRPLAVQRYAG